MANFPPLKSYLIFCLDKIIESQHLVGPFLDVGCGSGDVSEFLHSQGWQGRAIDISEQTAREAEKRLAPSAIRVACASIFSESGTYATVLALDVLEHIENDEAFLQKIATLLPENGKLLLAVPSHPREWRWDDDFYGHVRRYSPAAIKGLLERTGFRLVLCWDFTFPFFWFMRRLYAFLFHPRKDAGGSASAKTQQSARRNAWPGANEFGPLFRNTLLWRPVFWLQYHLFRKCTGLGHEMIILATKETKPHGQ